RSTPGSCRSPKAAEPTNTGILLAFVVVCTAIPAVGAGRSPGQRGRRGGPHRVGGGRAEQQFGQVMGVRLLTGGSCCCDPVQPEAPAGPPGAAPGDEVPAAFGG